MAKAKAKEELLERVVTGPKPIHAVDPKTGDRFIANIGDTVYLPAHTAKSFARYLQDPKVAAAQKAADDAVAEASAAEAEVEVATPNPPEPSESATEDKSGGGEDDSGES